MAAFARPGVVTQLRPLPTALKPSTGLSSAAALTVTPCTAALATVFERIMECNPSAEIERNSTDALTGNPPVGHAVADEPDVVICRRDVGVAGSRAFDVIRPGRGDRQGERARDVLDHQ